MEPQLMYPHRKSNVGATEGCGRNDKGQFLKGHQLNHRNRVLTTCKYCRKEYSIIPYRTSRTLFCSRNCKDLYRRGKANGWKGKHHTEESKKKMSNSHKGSKPGNKGIPHTEEAKAKMRRKRTPETCINISNSKKGHHTSEEQKRKTSSAIRQLYKEGKIQPFWKGKEPWKGKKHRLESRKKIADRRKGKTLSAETRLKISKALRGGKRPQCGEKNIGENNPNWKGGLSFEPYCTKFNRQLKDRIRERDNHTCQLCGVEENGRKLAIHHIHYDKPNCEPDLITLCTSCNAKVNFNRDYWEGRFIELLIKRGLLKENLFPTWWD